MLLTLEGEERRGQQSGLVLMLPHGYGEADPHHIQSATVLNLQSIVIVVLSAGEERWGQQSGLVLMLPHGYDGAGPDHSSARLERFLSLCNDDSDHLPGHSPAQRRQMSATFTALAKDHGGRLNRRQVLQSVVPCKRSCIQQSSLDLYNPC